MSIQLVVFELDGKEYGIDVKAINEILRTRKYNIQALPGSDSSIEGMINLRGNASFIFNLRRKFNLDDKEISDESKFIMLNTEKSTIGCLVDEVNDIVTLNDDHVEMLNFSLIGNSDYITGIGKFEDRMIVILDPEKIFSTDM